MWRVEGLWVGLARGDWTESKRHAVRGDWSWAMPRRISWIENIRGNLWTVQMAVWVNRVWPRLLPTLNTGRLISDVTETATTLESALSWTDDGLYQITIFRCCSHRLGAHIKLIASVQFFSWRVCVCDVSVDAVFFFVRLVPAMGPRKGRKITDLSKKLSGPSWWIAVNEFC